MMNIYGTNGTQNKFLCARMGKNLAKLKANLIQLAA